MHLVNGFLTLLALMFMIYFGILKENAGAFVIGFFFFWTSTIPWIINIFKSNR